MNHEEHIDCDGYLHKAWWNNLSQCHREDGPAYICHYPDGSIEYEEFCIAGNLHREDGPAYIYYDLEGSIDNEAFYVSGNFLGNNKKGFWALWEGLTEEGRQAPEILKYLARYS